MAHTDVALLLALTLTVVLAYPAKDDEGYYNRLHDFQDSYGKEVRNLDGIDAREEPRPLFNFLSKTSQAEDSAKGPTLKLDYGSSSHLDGIGGGHLVRDLELDQGGGNLLRDLDMLRNRAAYLSREQRAPGYLDPLLGSGDVLGNSKRSGCCDSLSGIGIGNQKRNMDEIDRSSFNSFIKKNFDEIDRSGFGSFVKRNFDEIDRSGFGSFVKRSAAPVAPAHSEASHN